MAYSLILSAGWSAIAEEIDDERDRQERMKREGKFKYTCADEMSDAERLPVLIEEVGEVARAMLEGGDVRSELVQVAAVCVAWLQGLNKQGAY